MSRSLSFIVRTLCGKQRCRLRLAACVLIQSIGRREMTRNQGATDVNRLEFIFKTVNAIASKKYDAITDYMLARAVLNEIDVTKRAKGLSRKDGTSAS